MRAIPNAGEWVGPDATGATYVEQFAGRDLSLGTYCLRREAADPQSPHDEDEVYHVVSGSGRFTSGDQTVVVGPGTTLFVPAREPHRFHDITDDLTILVFFAPPFGTRSSA